MHLSVALLLLSQGGCSWSDQNGTHHFFVGVGVGIVTSATRPGVDVRNSCVLGVLAGPDGAGAGVVQQHRVVIDPVLASNVVLSIKASPGALEVKHFDPCAQQTNATLK